MEYNSSLLNESDDQGRAGPGATASNTNTSWRQNWMEKVLLKEVNLEKQLGLKRASYAGPPYTPLSTTEQTIRLFVLLGGHFDDDIFGWLVEVPLSTKPKYMALSYVWGDDKDTVPIQVFEQKMQVTRNLEAALRHMRSPYGINWFWIDALCINQIDTAEKNVQVGLMGSVYQSATTVHVWLGKDAEEQQDIWPGSPERTIMAFEFARSFETVEISQVGKHIELLAIGFPNADGGLRAFLNLTRRNWFSRRSTIQEVVLPQIRNVRAQCVIFSVDWRAFIRTSTMIARRPALDGIWHPGSNLISEFFDQTLAPERIIALEDIQYMYGNSSLEDQKAAVILREMLSRTAGLFNETDKRDRIFALLSLIYQQPSNTVLKAEYGKSTADVFIDIARYLFNELETTQLLACSPGRGRDDRGLGLPSWVSTWSRKMTFQDRVRSEKQAISIFEDGRILRTKAFMVGRIETIVPPCPDLAIADVASFRQFFRLGESQILEPLSIAKKDGNKQESMEIWTRTLWPFTTTPQAEDDRKVWIEKHRAGKHELYETLMGRRKQMYEGLKTEELRDEFLAKTFQKSVSERRPFALDSGDIGTTLFEFSYDVKVDDLVCLIPGCSEPLIIRSSGDGFYLISQCFMDKFNSMEIREKTLLVGPLVEIAFL